MNKTKIVFLRRLRRALFWSLPSGETHAIVEDYSGFFDDRMAEGKTEAEVYREFGAPAKVAREILRESGRRMQPLGALIIVWVLLAGFLNWWWTWQTFLFSNSGYFWFYVVELLLIPVLWLCWRGALDNRKIDLPHPWRWRAAAFGIPAAAWAAFYGYYAWCILDFVPQFQFQVFPFEVETAGAKVGVIIGTLKEWGSLLVLAVLALLLVRTWREGSPRPLIGAAWCVGCLCSMSRLYVYSTWLNVMPFSPYSALLIPLAVLLIVGLGGTLLTALLIWKGGRHGRTA